MANITGTSGGTFSGPAGIVFADVSTGEIDLLASTVGGPYAITYTTGGACSNSTTDNVSIVLEDDPSFSYSSASYCQSGIDPLATISGTGGGSFSGPAGLVFLDTGTGEIDLSASTLGGPYTVTYSTTGTCANTSDVDITITDSPQAAFSYAEPFCEQGVNPLPTFDPGASAGSFSANPAGIVFVNVNTGKIDLTASTPGTYTVTNTIVASGGCAEVAETSSVTIQAIDDPSISYSQASYCQGDADPLATISGTGGGTFSGAAGLVFIDTGTGEIDLSASTTGGPYSVTYTTSGTCPNSSTENLSVLSEEDPSFSYSANSYCQGDSDPLATITGTTGGTFSEASGNLNITAETGLIDLSSSTAGGPYTVTYTTGGTCSNSSTYNVSVEAEEDPSFSYASNTYCQGGVDPTPAITGTLGGTFSEATGNLSIDALTGELDLSLSTPGGPYTVSYTTPGTCSNSSTFNITIIEDDPSFSYSATSYCQGDSDPLATITGTTGGTFSEASGNLSINSSTGLIDLSGSTAGGPYTVQYTTSGMCPIGSTWEITVVGEDDPSFGYSSTSYCQGDSDPLATITGTGGGTFSSTAGLVFLDTGTGEIDLSASTSGSVYSVSYATSGTCPNSSTVNVSILAEENPAFSYSQASYCQGGSDPLATITGTGGGTFSDLSGNLTINSNSGLIDLSSSSIGSPYTVEYTTPGTCSNSSTVSVSIVGEDDPSFSYGSNSYCQGDTDPLAIITGTGGGTFSSTAGLVFIDTGTGEIDLSASTAGSYDVSYTTTGACANSQSFEISIVAEDQPYFYYNDTSFCKGDLDPLPTITGTSGGSFTELTGNVDVNVITGLIDLSSSTVGNYLVNYTTSGTCSNSYDWVVNILEEENPAFTYSSASYCESGIDPVPVISGTIGGVFNESTGNLSLDALTGIVDADAGLPGNYSVTYTTSGTCSNALTQNITITEAPDGAFDYNDPFCEFAINPLPVMQTGAIKGVFSVNPLGLNFTDNNTGKINLSSSMAGSYTVYNTIAAANGCA
ncbi:MAG: hypothetical protein C0594_10730 [Marinilabiliales bacterium]|nr:MAG: hypothetical protein C0594_10730 [Marinilabiliales bacterium]